jgi:hypothetical protein
MVENADDMRHLEAPFVVEADGGEGRPVVGPDRLRIQAELVCDRSKRSLAG